MTSSGSSGSRSGCPINHEADSCPMAHSQRLNPKNNELPPNQQPASGQRKALPTERATSTIPTGASGGEPLWVYPSQQMFYNAMKRKGYAPQEEEMNTVVAIHNAVNERAWAEVRRAARCSAARGRVRAARLVTARVCAGGRMGGAWASGLCKLPATEHHSQRSHLGGATP